MARPVKPNSAIHQLPLLLHASLDSWLKCQDSCNPPLEAESQSWVGSSAMGVPTLNQRSYSQKHQREIVIHHRDFDQRQQSWKFTFLWHTTGVVFIHRDTALDLWIYYCNFPLTHQRSELLFQKRKKRFSYLIIKVHPSICFKGDLLSQTHNLHCFFASIWDSTASKNNIANNCNTNQFSTWFCWANDPKP